LTLDGRPYRDCASDPAWLAEFFAAAHSRFRVSARNKSLDFLLWRHSPEAFVNNEPLSSARLKASHALMMSFLVTASQLPSSKFQQLDVERASALVPTVMSDCRRESVTPGIDRKADRRHNLVCFFQHPPVPRFLNASM
jgi:hypothetical protein